MCDTGKLRGASAEWYPDKRRLPVGEDLCTLVDGHVGTSKLEVWGHSRCIRLPGKGSSEESGGVGLADGVLQAS